MPRPLSLLGSCKDCAFAGRGSDGRMLCALNPPVCIGLETDPTSLRSGVMRPVWAHPEVYPDSGCSHWQQKGGRSAVGGEDQ